MGEEGHDFSGLTDLDLVEMQKRVRPSAKVSVKDREFLQAILVELGKRHKAHLEENREQEVGKWRGL